MIFALIVLLTSIVFASRYLFLDPKVPLRLSSGAQRFLSYASPAVLTAIWGPIVFMPHGELLFEDNLPYLIGAVFAIVLARLTSNVLLTTIVSIVLFLMVKLYLF